MSRSLRKRELLVALIVLFSFHGLPGRSGSPSDYKDPLQHSLPNPLPNPLPHSKFLKDRDTAPPACRSPALPVPEFVRIVSPTALSDTTPPTPPRNLTVFRESIHNLFGRWEEASDPESGITYYVFGIGSEPGEVDISWWQSTGLSLSSYGQSMKALGCEEGDTIYFSVCAVNGADLWSEAVCVGPIVFSYDPLGMGSNEITIEFAGPWSQTELLDLEWFTSRMLPIIQEIYGAPSHSYTVTLVKDSTYSSSAIFFPGSNEIHMDQLHPQLLTHEIIHAFRDNVILSTDDVWSYDPTLSGFEESFAQGMSYVCMNRYLELYPADPIVPGNTIYGSTNDWDYDYHNTDILTTTDYWSDGSGTGIYWLRYEMGAAAVLKILQDHPDFARNFNREYYQSLNADHDLTTSRELMIDIISYTAPEIEGRESTDWISRQHIFDCRVRSGHKIWVKTQHYPGWEEYLIFQDIYYYETFANGSEWAYWDPTMGEWVYHNLNGSTGYGRLYDTDGDIVWQKDLLIEPVQNPPFYYGFGNETVNLSTDEDTSPWPGGDPDDFILDLTNPGFYRLRLEFGSESTEVIRVMGDSLRHTSGVFGAVLNSTGGEIYLKHEDYPEEPPIPMINGSFHGERAWASIDNPNTGYRDSDPGRVFVIYRDENGNTYRDRRNIDLGSWEGNQLFLFDTHNMTLIVLPDRVVLVSPADAGIVQTDSVQFVWRSSVPEVSGYWFELATDSLFENSSIDSMLTAADTTRMVGSLINDQKYWWRVRAKNPAGWGEFSESRNFSVTATDIEDQQAGRIPIQLSQNYPNPFNGATTIGYNVPEISTVTLKVYDLLGREVENLVSGDIKQPGSYEVAWEPRGIGSGIYFYRLEITCRVGSPAKRIVQTRKIMYLK